MPDTAPPRWWLVDVCNVVGSRPDGWWHDRVGANARLVGRLAALVADDVTVTAVVDGDPSARLPAGPVRGVEVVHAGRARDAADDRIVALLTAADGRPATVVTADRDLRRRATALGADVAGPRQLLARLPEDAPG